MLVFVAAERRELEGLVVHVDEITKPGWSLDFARLGRLHGRLAVMVANGPGPKLARIAVDRVREHAVKANERLEALISIGFCGGLKPVLEACDIFVASEINGAPALAPSSSRPFKTGRLVSMDRVISTAAEKREFGRDADAVEMEAAAVADRARQWDVPFYAVRVVTDTCSESFPVDFNQVRTDSGHFSRAAIVRAALTKPVTVIPELIKLNERTKRAAEVLGDFLAEARF